MATAVAGLRKGRAMDKILCFGALGVGVVMALLFLLDLAAGFPFGGGPFVVVDVVGLLSSAIVIYLALNAKKDLK
jgi:hypothetical protein